MKINLKKLKPYIVSAKINPTKTFLFFSKLLKNKLRLLISRKIF
jgi:hypothetical protein